MHSLGYETASTTPELGELKTKPKQLPIPEQCDCGMWNGGVVQGSAQSVLVATFKTQPNDEGALKISHGCATTFNKADCITPLPWWQDLFMNWRDWDQSQSPDKEK